MPAPDPFESLMRTHERRVLNVALRMVGRREDAEDVAQEVFLKLYRHQDSLEAGRPVEPWLYRTTVNASLDLLRRRTRTVELVVEPAAHGSVERAAEARQEWEWVEQGLLTLGEKERAALVLRDLEGLDTSAVAAVLESSEVTVRSQIAKARLKLKKYLEERRSPL